MPSIGIGLPFTSMVLFRGTDWTGPALELPRAHDHLGVNFRVGGKNNT